MINLRYLVDDIKAAIAKIEEAEKHIPVERFKMMVLLLEDVKSILEGMAEEMEKEVKRLGEERGSRGES